ncbi:unnamed protein product [Mytilus coruscus]|uniref:Fibrinogen C-terminal domain-containing protein n=1 Tax=Mytilus coruscus TaxID=42192 RepID=A0A6J8AE08_MYTCO|nr:unnamed protein product [Mytilus coruscus]
MHMIRIVVAVLLLFVAAITKVHCNSFSTKFKTRITSYETIIETITVPTFVACARECTRDDCCTACYNKATNKCHLHGDCFPVSEHSDSGVFIRKNDVKTSNDATTQDTTRDRTTLENTSDKPTTNYQTPYKESDDLTTTMKQTVRDITGNFKTTRDKRSTAATIERKTENRTVAMIIDCSEIRSGSLSGIYTIYVENQANDVYCEMRGDGQWTVIQRRLDGTTDFYRNWHEYKQGFGNVNLEYWLGSIYQMYGMEFSTSDRITIKNPFHKAAESKRSGWWLKWSTDANLMDCYKGGQIASDEFSGSLGNLAFS